MSERALKFIIFNKNIIVFTLILLSFLIYNIFYYDILFRYIGYDSPTYIGLIKAMLKDINPMRELPKEILYPEFYKYKNAHIGPNILLMVLLSKYMYLTPEFSYSIMAIVNLILLSFSYYCFCRMFFPEREAFFSVAFVFLFGAGITFSGFGSFVAWGFMVNTIGKSFFFSTAFNFLSLRFFIKYKCKMEAILFIIFFLIGFLSNVMVSFIFLPIFILFIFYSENGSFSFSKNRAKYIIILFIILLLFSKLWIYYDWIEVLMGANIFKIGERINAEINIQRLVRVLEDFSVYIILSFFLLAKTQNDKKFKKILFLILSYFIIASLSGFYPYKIPRYYRFIFVGVFFMGMSFSYFLQYSKNTFSDKMIKYVIILFLMLGFITNTIVYVERISINNKDQLSFLKEYNGTILAYPYLNYGIQAYTNLKTYTVADGHEGSMYQKIITDKIKNEIIEIYDHNNIELLNQFYKNHKFNYILVHKNMKRLLEEKRNGLIFNIELVDNNNNLYLYEVI